MGALTGAGAGRSAEGSMSDAKVTSEAAATAGPSAEEVRAYFYAVLERCAKAVERIARAHAGEDGLLILVDDGTSASMRWVPRVAFIEDAAASGMEESVLAPLRHPAAEGLCFVLAVSARYREIAVSMTLALGFPAPGGDA